jgi:hypothetical protein
MDLPSRQPIQPTRSALKKLKIYNGNNFHCGENVVTVVESQVISMCMIIIPVPSRGSMP